MKKKKILFTTLVLAILVIPTIVFAKDTPNLDKILTDGKLVLKSVPPTNDEEYYAMVSDPMYDLYGEGYMATKEGEIKCNKDYTKCTIYYEKWEQNAEKGYYEKTADESKEVEITYVYDEDIKKVVDEITKDFPERAEFQLTDVEYLNYLVYAAGKEGSEDASMVPFSADLRKLINYKNFGIDVRMGEDSFFYQEKGGMAKITYEGTTYYQGGVFLIGAKRIIYVDDDVKDIEKAVREKVNKLFPNGEIKVADAEMTMTDYFESEREIFINEYNGYLIDYNKYHFHADVIETYKDAAAYADYRMNELYYNEDAPYHFLTECEEKIIGLTVNDYLMTSVAVIKDSKKANTQISYKSSDVRTDVTISTDGMLPLDTLIQAKKLTSGADYEKIIKLLDIETGETYDLSLFSNSSNKKITKLENGKFQVAIPISDELKDKNLVVYFVNDDDTIEEYEVTIKDGYAIFETDHFSIYTLGAAPETPEVIAPAEEDVTNPNTIDNIAIYSTILVLSTLGTICINRKFRKAN